MSRRVNAKCAHQVRPPLSRIQGPGVVPAVEVLSDSALESR